MQYTVRDHNVDQRPPSDAVYTLRLLGRRILQLTSETRDLEQRIADVIAAHTPTLLEQRGIGPNSAAALITAGDNPRSPAQRGIIRHRARTRHHRAIPLRLEP